MAAFDETPFLELGTNPIPGGSPCGADIAEDEEYILIQQEAGKLDRIDAGEPDWIAMEEAGANILRNKSKDVEVASILGLCLFKRHGYAGLASVLGLVTGLVNNFWDGCFPDRPRRRKARIEGLADRFSEGGWFRDHQPKSGEFDAVDLCVTRIAELDAALKAKMPDEPGDFSKFTRGIKELAGRRPKAAAPAASAEGGAAAPPGVAAAGGVGMPPVGEVADSGSATNAVLTAVTFLRKADPADPLPYALLRAIKWSRIALPTSDAGKFQIEPPENTLVETLTHQFNNSLWENVLKNAEAAFRSNDPLWLDLQRYVCTAMVRLGPNYEPAHRAVVAAVAGLVNRLGEGLFELRFRNGNALCSGETKLWIESEVAPPAKASGGVSAASNGKLAESADKSRKLAGEGKVREAVEHLREGMLASNERRERFLWRLATARLCHDAQRLQLALPLLEECREEVERYHIDEWEPTLALEVAQILYRCRKALVAAEKDPTREAQQGVRDAFGWLCQLDPLAALSAEPA